MKYFTLLLFTLLLTGCDVSTLSEKDSNNFSKFRVNITIEDGIEDNSLNQIRVLLSDGKKQVINENIKVLLNEMPLELYVKQELYYTKRSFYRTDSLSRADSYYFEIILPDSTRYPLAFIKPNKTNMDTQFNIPDKFNENSKYVIEWTNLNIPHELDYIKGIQVKKKKAENITEYGYSDRKIDTLRTKTGKYEIPKSYFQDSLKTTTHLEISIKRTENGLINPNLLEKSDITYNYSFEKVIDAIE